MESAGDVRHGEVDHSSSRGRRRLGDIFVKLFEHPARRNERAERKRRQRVSQISQAHPTLPRREVRIAGQCVTRFSVSGSDHARRVRAGARSGEA